MDTDHFIREIIAFLPDRWAVYAPFFLLMLSGLCNILAIGLKPPVIGARHYALRKIYYLLVTWGALNLGRAANRLQCEHTGLMVKRDEADNATSILGKAGIQVLSRADHFSRQQDKQQERNLK